MFKDNEAIVKVTKLIKKLSDLENKESQFIKNNGTVEFELTDKFWWNGSLIRLDNSNSLKLMETYSKKIYDTNVELNSILLSLFEFYKNEVNEYLGITECLNSEAFFCKNYEYFFDTIYFIVYSYNYCLKEPKKYFNYLKNLEDPNKEKFHTHIQYNIYANTILEKITYSLFNIIKPSKKQKGSVNFRDDFLSLIKHLNICNKEINFLDEFIRKVIFKLRAVRNKLVHTTFFEAKIENIGYENQILFLFILKIVSILKKV